MPVVIVLARLYLGLFTAAVDGLAGRSGVYLAFCGGATLFPPNI